MLPAVVSLRRTANWSFAYAVATLAASLTPVVWGGAGAIYTASAAGLGGALVVRADGFRRRADVESARALFRFSLVYLAGLFLALVVDRTIGA
jgi:protoheme IX farnesyltransferase